MPDATIAVAGLSKFLGDRIVLRNLDFAAAPGEFKLVLGANGAGKSTLLRIMAGLSSPTSGVVKRREGARLAYIGHATFLYPRLTALQNLAFQAKIHRLPLQEEHLLDLLKKTGLAGHAHEPVRFFSRGMAQRLNFCRALMPDPELLLLDEPFTGMDADSRTTMRSELARRRDNGACVVMVSHEPATDAIMATEVLTLARGRLAASGAPC